MLLTLYLGQVGLINTIGLGGGLKEFQALLAVQVSTQLQDMVDWQDPRPAHQGRFRGIFRGDYQDTASVCGLNGCGQDAPYRPQLPTECQFPQELILLQIGCGDLL